MLPPHTPELNPTPRGTTATVEPPRQNQGSLVPLQIELPQVLNAPWNNAPAGPGPLPPLTISVAGVLNSFRRRWWSLALGALIGTAALLLAWFFVPPQIEVESILKLDRDVVEIAGQKKSMQRDEWEGYKATQAQLVKTRMAMLKALDSKDPETGRPLQELPVVRGEWDKTGWLQSKIRVWFPGDAAIMVIGMKGEEPAQMVKLVNAVTENYITEFVGDTKLRQRKDLEKLKAAHLDLQKQYDLARSKYEVRAKQLRAINKESLTFKHQAATATLQALQSRAQQLKSRLTDKQVEIIELKQKMQLVEGLEPSQSQIEEKLHENPKYLDKVRTREAYLAELREAEAKWAEKNAPQPKRIRAKIDALDHEVDQLKDELAPTIREGLAGDTASGAKAAISASEQAVTLITEELKGIDTALAEAQTELNSLHASYADLDSMQNHIDGLKEQIGKVHQEILHAELNVDSAAPITVYNKASAPEGSIDWMRFVMVGMLGSLGFVLPVVGLIAWDYAQRRINSSSDLPESFGVKLVGAIPNLRDSGQKKKRKGGDAELLTGRNPLADAVDGVRTALMRDSAAQSTRIVLVTSPVGREGKTTLATQLAASLGRAGRRTLLIDGDLRHPSAHRVLGMAQDPGLAEILRGEVEIEETIRPTRSNGLWMIPAGNFCEDALHAMARDGVQEVFKELSSGFDFVIIDAPPVLTDSDTLVIGQHVDAAIISVLRDASRVPQIYEARDRLRTVGVRLLGCVYHGARGEQRSARPKLAAK